MIAVYTIAAALVAIAEFGDKTQMLTLMLAARYRTRQVLLGVGIAILALQALAVTVGGVVGTVLPQRVIGIGAGLLFIGFGLFALRGAFAPPAEETEDAAPKTARFGPVAATAIAFFVAELGDKTQLMTMSIAADPRAAAGTLALFDGISVPDLAGPAALLAVWLGSTTGMFAVNGLAALAGGALGARISRKAVALLSGVVFLGFGIATLVVTLT